MTGIHTRFGWSIALVRTGLEVSALVVGWLLGGTVGVGTAVFAFGVGPVLAMFLRLLARRFAARPAPPGELTDAAT